MRVAHVIAGVHVQVSHHLAHRATRRARAADDAAGRAIILRSNREERAMRIRGRPSRGMVIDHGDNLGKVVDVQREVWRTSAMP